MAKKIDDKTAKKIAKAIDGLTFKSDAEKERAGKIVARALEGVVLASDATGHAQMMLDLYRGSISATSEAVPKTIKEQGVENMVNLDTALSTAYGISRKDRRKKKYPDTKTKTTTEMRTTPPDQPGKDNTVERKFEENKKDITSKKDLVEKAFKEKQKNESPSKKDLVEKAFKENTHDVGPSKKKLVERMFKENTQDVSPSKKKLVER